MFLERRTGESVDILAFKKVGNKYKFLVRFADGTRIWRDSEYIQIGLSPEALARLKESAAQIVADILSGFRTPFFTRIITTSMRDLADKIVFVVRVEFWDAQGGRSSIEIPLTFDKKKSVFYRPTVLYWNGEFHRISQEVFNRFFRRVPRFLAMNIFSPRAPLEVKILEKLL